MTGELPADNTTGELPTDEDFVKIYGSDALIITKAGAKPMPLGFALDLEAEFCEVPSDRRSDPYGRAQFLARSLARAGVPLAPEHEPLLDQEG